MKLLIITQKIDITDSNLGFFHCWLEKFAQKLEKLYTICLWQGEYNLPPNTTVYLMGKERGYSKLRQFFNLQKFLLKYLSEVDGVFIHMCPIYVVASYPLIKIFRKKIILWYIHKTINWKLKLAEKLVDKILTASPDSCQLKNRKKIKVVGHGIDTELFKSLTTLPLSEDKLRILFVGRIAPIKDLETLILAFDILINQKKLKDIELKIVGDVLEDYEKKYKKKIKKLVAEKKLEDYIKLLGDISYPKVVKYYQDSDMLINLSSTGGMDKVVLEAMACGLPVLVCNRTFEKDLTRFKDILIFQEKNPRDLAQKILNLKNLNQTEIGNYLRAQIVQNHNLDRLINKIISLFEK